MQTGTCENREVAPISRNTVLLLSAAALAAAAIYLHVSLSTPAERQAFAEAAALPSPYTLPSAELIRAQALFRTEAALYFIGSLWGILQLVLLLALKVPSRIQGLVERTSSSRWGQCFFFVFLFFGLNMLLNAPLRLYGHHIGLVYGLSVQGWASWALDWFKSFLLAWIVGGLLVMVLFWIIRRSPQRWWFWFWIPTMAAVLFGVYLSPILVDPLFNKFEPLQSVNPALVRQLERVAAQCGVDLPPARMFYMRASQKVTGMNAYVTGFGPSKRLVLWDTTVAQATPDELSGVFGHELGHYALHHIELGVLFAAAALLLGFFAGQRITWYLLRRFGARWGVRSQQDWACLAVLMLVLNFLSFFSAPVENAFSRAIEHDADIYGQEAIHGIVADPQGSTVAGFQRLGESSLEDPTMHLFAEFWMFSHPAIGLRASFAAVYNPWHEGLHPKYFHER